MATYEYNDLFQRAQSDGIYHVFVFDIVKSKEMNNEERYLAQIKMEQLMFNIYDGIKHIEEMLKKKILVFEKDFVNYSEKRSNGFGLKYEPFLFGDSFGFTIYRDTISDDLVMNLFHYYYKKLEINFNFHVADAFYETNDYELGNIKYFRGYCIDTVANIHKPYFKKELKIYERVKNK